MNVSDRAVAVAIGAIAALAYLSLGIGLGTDYDYYGRLALALVHGHWWLDQAPYWLNELLECGADRSCVAYPPLPAVLAIPFLPFGSVAAQVLASRLFGGASAGVLYWSLRGFGAPRAYSVAGAVLSAFGTTLFFSSVDGRAWYAAHAVAVVFLCAAFGVATRGGSAVLVGTLIGLAALARLPVAAAFPALALIVATRGGISYRTTIVRVAAGAAPLALAYVGYNLLRWGTPFDDGYARLAEGDFFFNHGLFSPLYLPRHLYAIFLQPPDIVDGTPFFIRPRFFGMSLVLTTPAFLWIVASVRSVRRGLLVGTTAGAALLALMPDVLHGTVGFAQFGYRFSLDAQPFLIALAVAGDGLSRGLWRTRPSTAFVVAIGLSLLVNIYATIAITRFDYWQ